MWSNASCGVVYGWVQTPVHVLGSVSAGLDWAGLRSHTQLSAGSYTPAQCPASPAPTVTSFRYASLSSSPQLCAHWLPELPVKASPRVKLINVVGAWPRAAALRRDWLAEPSLRLHKGVTAFTWKPTACSSVCEARANQYGAAAGEWSSAHGWLTAAQSQRLLSKLLYKCV